MKIHNYNQCATRLSRRDFLYLSGIGTVALLSGCAVHPVTGRRQLMLMSEDQEIRLDRENSPHQISADYGLVQDQALNDYISGVGRQIAGQSHRPDMPYSFNTLNASYVNAYAFPGGTIGLTRGILLDLENEAELASLIGHEVGHVSARHTAQRMTRGLLAAAVFSGAAVAAGPELQNVVAGLGGIGAGALLASYSRNQEREADELGLDYMAGSGYNPQGFVGLMEMLMDMSGRDKGHLAVLFATHPMSSERYQTALIRADAERALRDQPVYRERYMDNISGLRRIEEAIRQLQEGDDQMMDGNPVNARKNYDRALVIVPDDYAANLKQAKCLLALNQGREAEIHALAAREAYPDDPQAVHVLGMIHLNRNSFDQALTHFEAYNTQLPGNPNNVFFRGYCLEGMGRRDRAAGKYYAYLQHVSSGDYARHAHARLQEWGYI